MNEIVMVDWKYLVEEYNFTEYRAKKYIREKKQELANKGLTYYDNRRLSHIPHDVVKIDLGIEKVM